MRICAVRAKGTVGAILKVHAHLCLEPRPTDGIFFASRPGALLGGLVTHGAPAMNRIEALLEDAAHKIISRRNPDGHEAFERRSFRRRVKGRDALERVKRGLRVIGKRRRIHPVVESRHPRSGVGGTFHRDSTVFSSLEWLEGGRSGHKLGSPWHCRLGSAESVEVEVQTFAPRLWALNGGRARPFTIWKTWSKVTSVCGETRAIRAARLGKHHRNWVLSCPVGWGDERFLDLCAPSVSAHLVSATVRCLFYYLRQKESGSPTGKDLY